jgi:hypothetical protein
MTQDEILDRVVEIIETSPDPFPKEEWHQLNENIRKLHDPAYGLGFWHKGYSIHFHGSKILHSKMTEAQYEDMMKVYSNKMTVKEYNEKYNAAEI